MYRMTRCGMMALLLFSTILVIGSAERCAANNNYFIPGDAFFYFEINQDEWESFKSGENSLWTYDRPSHLPLMLCGYAGYRHMDVSALPNDYRERLIKVVDIVKKEYPAEMKTEIVDSGFNIKEEKTIEINKIRVFVYSNEFDFAQHRIGLKYNESWPAMGPRFGHSTKHFQFDFFVNTPKAISDSWRMAANVKPLNVELPKADKGAVETPIPFNPNQLKFLIAPPVEIESLCYPSRDANHVCYVVSKSNTLKLKVKKSKWISSDL